MSCKPVIVLSAVLIILSGISAAAQTEAVVRSVSGKVEIQATGSDWRSVEPGDTIGTGATISTGFNSEAVLEIGSATLRVKQLTRMRLDELIEREGTVKTELFLRVGRVTAEVKQREGLQQDFQLRSPVSTAAVRGTTFSYDGVNLEVIEGLVALANAYNQSIAVSAGQEVEMSGLDLPPEGLAALEKIFDVNTSAAQIEGIIENLSVETTPGVGSVAVQFVLPG